MHFFPRQGYLQSCWPYLDYPPNTLSQIFLPPFAFIYITTICATIFTKYAEITICRQKIVAILFPFLYNRPIRSIKDSTIKILLSNFISWSFSSRELLRIFSSIFSLLSNAARTTFSLFNIHFIFMKRPRKMWGLMHCLLPFILAPVPVFLDMPCT